MWGCLGERPEMKASSEILFSESNWKRNWNQHMLLAVAFVKKAFLKIRLRRADRLPNPLISLNLPDPPSLFVSSEFT